MKINSVKLNTVFRLSWTIGVRFSCMISGIITHLSVVINKIISTYSVQNTFKFSPCFRALTELHALGYASKLTGVFMVVGFTTSCAISAFHYLPVSCEFKSLSWRGVLNTTLCDKFVSDLRQVGDFLRIFLFPPPIKLNAMI